MVRRSRLEIYFDILDVIDRGIDKPTRIMYKANLSWNSLQETFTTLLKGNFIREDIVKNSKRYYITEKGKSALYYHRKSLEDLPTLRTRVHPHKVVL
jgi:predicted transcriptional regulator